MAFLESRLSPRITHGALGGPTVPGRHKHYTTDGRLRQTFTSSMPIHRYDISHGIRSRDDFQTVLDLFYVVMFTPYEGFRFKDWRDFILTRANSRLVQISGTSYRINRVHTFSGQEFLRPIYKPVSAVTVYNAGGSVLASSTDITTGIVTVASGSPATCTGEFDVPVTFTDDEWMSSLQVSTDNLHVDAGSIKLEEIRL